MARKKQNTEQQRNLITWTDRKSPVSEQYRTIRTNIQYASVDKDMQTILITSAGPGEGKSTTVANLGITMAQQGKSTLIVDADLRKPTVHYTFRTMNTHGVTNVLTHQSRFSEVVQETEVDNLHIVPSGPIPPNPAELLSAKKMEQIFVEAKQEFDVILLDAPPVLPVTDSQVLAANCDGSILVIKSGQTDKQAGLKAKELLEKAGASILGTVLNQRKALQQQYYYYYGNP
ncbi:CpsD/CapB family tyrosine-protein kinase [Alteribacillus sp. YIM 98480]|uniref:CpsD/CapB family tyrosine-protein kinase n=1 Tax=Alteribacillus sp. YIM 98480 TaxID=2606599 RepID=UPI00131B1DED|nr:CpsD/CapB family tyrosine-protein kinase [Alteribacillus sp. YIM 98480]